MTKAELIELTLQKSARRYSKRSHITYTLCYVYVKINYYDTKYLGQH
jgi:hypothetical protein